MSNILKIQEVEEKILSIRGENVLLDSDVAFLYGVQTKEINQAVKNNPKKFPDGYIVQLDKGEWQNLKSKILTSSWGGKNKIPNVFTEKGLYMLATILKGDKAIDTTLAIVEAFAKIKELSHTISELAKAPNEQQQKTLLQKRGEIMADLVGGDLNTTDIETTFELNLAVMKFKHTVKKGRENN